MTNSLLSDERAAFAQRLSEAMRKVGIAQSATVLARVYNAGNPTIAVTSHAVRKWMEGESIPAQERVQALAQLLGTTPNWLRYGEAQSKGKESCIAQPIQDDIFRIVEDARRLDPRSRELLDVLLEQMLKQQNSG